MQDDRDESAVLGVYARIFRTVHGDGRDNLQRILTTCEQMLRDRGCHVVHRPVDWLDRVSAVAPARPVMSGQGEGGVHVRVYIHGEDKVSVKYMRAVVDQCREAEADEAAGEGGDAPRVTGVVISPDGPTPFARRECDGQRIQFMHARHMCVNVTKHSLVPRHEAVADVPAHMTKSDLPLLLTTDPIAQYYDWPIGTVVRVERHFGGHEPIPYFRVVATCCTN